MEASVWSVRRAKDLVQIVTGYGEAGDAIVTGGVCEKAGGGGGTAQRLRAGDFHTLSGEGRGPGSDHDGLWGGGQCHYH